MTLASKAANRASLEQKKSRYVDCDNCSMQAICLPIGSESQTIDLTNNYLTRRVEVIPEQHSSNKLNKKMALNYLSKLNR
jgi:CRP/FNR family transcriptional regulator